MDYCQFDPVHDSWDIARTGIVLGRPIRPTGLFGRHRIIQRFAQPQRLVIAVWNCRRVAQSVEKEWQRCHIEKCLISRSKKGYVYVYKLHNMKVIIMILPGIQGADQWYTVVVQYQHQLLRQEALGEGTEDFPLNWEQRCQNAVGDLNSKQFDHCQKPAVQALPAKIFKTLEKIIKNFWYKKKFEIKKNIYFIVKKRQLHLTR